MKTATANLAGWLATMLPLLTLAACLFVILTTDSPAKALTFGVLGFTGCAGWLGVSFQCGQILAERRRRC